jgi:pyridoxal phosphate enzyme (YggS family)
VTAPLPVDPPDERPDGRLDGRPDDRSDDLPDDRAVQLASNLATVENRIRSACDAAGRGREEVTLVVVTKYFPASDVRLLAEAGVRHVAENRHQEAVAKREACPDLDLTWHFIGGLQSNKAAAVGGWADVVQSVDRAKLLAPLGRAAHERSRLLDVLVQVNLDPPSGGDRQHEKDGRSGVLPQDAVALAERAAATEGVQLRGVMAVAPREGDPAAAFARLADVATAVRAVVPAAGWVSAGMSGDLEAAIAAGATHVRVGTAVLGTRPLRG